MTLQLWHGRSQCATGARTAALASFAGMSAAHMSTSSRTAPRGHSGRRAFLRQEQRCRPAGEGARGSPHRVHICLRNVCCEACSGSEMLTRLIAARHKHGRTVWHPVLSSKHGVQLQTRVPLKDSPVRSPSRHRSQAMQGSEGLTTRADTDPAEGRSRRRIAGGAMSSSAVLQLKCADLRDHTHAVDQAARGLTRC